HDDTCAFRCEFAADGFAEAGASAGDECYFSCEVRHDDAPLPLSEGTEFVTLTTCNRVLGVEIPSRLSHRAYFVAYCCRRSAHRPTVVAANTGRVMALPEAMI